MAPDWWFAQFERDLAELGGDGTMSNADYDRIAEGTTQRFLDNAADQADALRQQQKDEQA